MSPPRDSRGSSSGRPRQRVSASDLPPEFARLAGRFRLLTSYAARHPTATDDNLEVLQRRIGATLAVLRRTHMWGAAFKAPADWKVRRYAEQGYALDRLAYLHAVADAEVRGFRPLPAPNYGDIHHDLEPCCYSGGRCCSRPPGRCPRAFFAVVKALPKLDRPLPPDELICHLDEYLARLEGVFADATFADPPAEG